MRISRLTCRVTVALLGTLCVLTVPGVAPALAATGPANPSTLDFGSVPVNTTVTLPDTITVDTGYQVDIAGGTGLDAPFHFSFDTCGANGGFNGPGTCTIKESYSPTDTSTAAAETDVDECPLAGGSCIPIAINLSGAGVLTAAASPSTLDFGSVPVNTSVTLPDTITVDTGYQVDIAGGTGLSAPFQFSFDTCGANGGFNGPGTCTIKQSYSPTDTSTAAAETDVDECPLAGGSCIPIAINLSGTGVLTAAASPSALDFGNVPVNTTVTLPDTLTVDTGYEVDIAGGTGLSAPFQFSFGTCTSTAEPFKGPGTCTIKESYSPTDTSTASAEIDVDECPLAGGSCIPIAINLSGTGVLKAAASPSTLDFGTVPVSTTVTRPVTLTVDTGYEVDIAGGTGLDAPFQFSFGTCASTAGPFKGPGTCTVQESFSPTDTSTSTGDIEVAECPVTSGACVSIPFGIVGTGGVPAASVTPNLTFSDQGLTTTSASQPVTVTNSGTVPLHMSTTSISGDFAVATNGCAGHVVAVGASCEVDVTFTPTAAGSRTGALSFTDDAAGSPQSVPLTGSGVTPTVTVTPGSLTFPSRTVGTTSPTQTVTIINTSTVGMRITNLATTGDYAIASTGTCSVGGVVAASSQCTVEVSFHPTATGPRNGALVLSDTASGSPQVLALAGTGAAGAPGATLTISNPAITTSRSTIATVASFTSSNASAQPGDFVATISWGDGGAPVAGTVSSSSSGFLVGGAHAYTHDGTYSVVVKVSGGGAPAVTGTTSLKASGTTPSTPAECRGTIVGGTVHGPIVVPAGMRCGLTDVTITGKADVKAGAVLTMAGGSIGDNLTNEGGSLLLGPDSAGNGITVHGALTSTSSPAISLVKVTTSVGVNLKGTSGTPTGLTANRICASSITGDLRITNNSRRFVVGDSSLCGASAGNKVTGSLVVQTNTVPSGSAAIISSNKVGVDLSCSGNHAAATGTHGSNVVTRHKLGECAGL